MDDKQLAVLYTIMLVIWVGAFVLLHHLSKPQTSTEQYADKICQDLYGPQTGHKWIDGKLKCETVRGEILQLRRM